MNRVTRCQREGRTSRSAGMVWRCGVGLLLILQIVYTPLHLYLEPHAGDADFRRTAASERTAGIAGHHDHDDHGDANQHSASQHKLKSLRSPRIAAVDLVCDSAPTLTVAEMDRPALRVWTRSGLSPPELSGSWQFLLRAALPVRAPSLAS